MNLQKKTNIKTADLEANIRALKREIDQMEHMSKTGVQRLIDDFRDTCVTYTDGSDEIEPYSFMVTIPRESVE